MAKSDKRRHHDDVSPDLNKKRKRPIFSSHLDIPNLAPAIKLLCEIIANTTPQVVEKILDETHIRISQETVEEVLKLSYAHPGAAVKFFRWSAYKLNDKHSPYAWNLVVDLLGKNSHFDAMWDAIRSMKKECLLSLATFASVFSSYVIADRVRDAIMTFDVMEQYGCKQDIIALNSLLSAICRDGKTLHASEFLHVVDGRIKADADTYAILLEGWEKEGDVVCAKKTFAEMVVDIGWDPENVPAYDSFLNTLLKSRDGIYEAVNSLKRMIDRGCRPGIKFFKVALEECLKGHDVRGAELIWEAMVARIGFRPDTQMYNTIITLYCCSNKIDTAIELLDEMVYNGAFPDRQTYNILFQFLIKSRKLKEASVLFNEMVKNECVLNHDNCRAAVRVYMDSGDPYMAIKIWKYMIENHHSDLAESGDLLVVGLCDMHMFPEAAKYARAMAEKGIRLTPSSLLKLKQSLTKARKEILYEEILTKCKDH
ncbi:Pentatricopeptide repeat-containing protein [Melia azedarach]|uniref:Pentatricopeptide repeat-containing protein n=1 Tax=Melia azedarach TaxID=155640 RepID=A0ACC1X705_MELAZ|nr:Pentatricopeptide repeat-containing protein [Melia azedarach]